MTINWKQMKINILILIFIVILNIYYELDVQFLLIIYMSISVILFLANKLNLTTLLCILFCSDTFHKIKFNLLGPNIYFNQIYLCMIILGVFLKKIKSKYNSDIIMPMSYIYIFIYISVNMIFNISNTIPKENWNVLIMISLSVLESILIFNLLTF